MHMLRVAWSQLSCARSRGFGKICGHVFAMMSASRFAFQARSCRAPRRSSSCRDERVRSGPANRRRTAGKGLAPRLYHVAPIVLDVLCDLGACNVPQIMHKQSQNGIFSNVPVFGVYLPCRIAFAFVEIVGRLFTCGSLACSMNKSSRACCNARILARCSSV
jgi:hypothetical protein